MKAICLVDTSVFVEFLAVPKMASRTVTIVKEMKRKVANEEQLFLPMATVFETGNHIGQNGDGNQRRQCAERFVRQVQLALAGDSPFTPIDFVEADKMQRWLDEFPDWAMQGSGLGDLSIRHDWERLCEKNKGRRVYIWSLDQHLGGFDRGPEL